MPSFEKYVLKQQHKNVAALGDKLSQFGNLSSEIPSSK